MIEFCGKPSEKSKMSTHKINNKMMLFFFLGFSLVLLIIAVIGLIIDDNAFVTLGFAGFVGGVTITILTKFLRPAKSVLKLGSVDKFIFDNDSVTFIQNYGGSEAKKIRPISKIKKIVDAGEWYHIVFRGIVDNYWVCQKNLITKGTNEEFEKFFEGKIRIKK